MILCLRGFINLFVYLFETRSQAAEEDLELTMTSNFFLPTPGGFRGFRHLAPHLVNVVGAGDGTQGFVDARPASTLHPVCFKV